MTSWLHWLGLWEFDPPIWIGSVVALLAYRWLPGARRDWRAAAWIAGVLVALISLQSALDVVGKTELFTAHMAQHLLLAMVVPPLVLRGLPDESVDMLLEGRLGPPLRFLVHPLCGASAYFMILVLWHVPALLDNSLANSSLYLAQHLSFLGVGLLFWWAVVIHRPGERWNLSALGEVAYLTCGALPSVVVGLTLSLSPAAIYTFYLHRTTILGISAVSDQRWGGLLMFGFDNAVMVAFAGYYFWRLFPVDGSDERGNSLLNQEGHPVQPPPGPWTGLKRETRR